MLLALAGYGAFMGPSIAAGPSPVLILHGPVSNDEMRGHVDFFIDDDWSETPQTMLAQNADRFQPILKKHPDFGYTKSRVWLRTRLLNATNDVKEWRLFFAENFKQHFSVWAVRQSGAIETLVSLKPDSPFSARDIPYPELATALDLEPGEQVTILISLWSEGSSYIELGVETQESFAARTARDTAKNFIFYGMMLLLIAIAMGCLALFRQVIFLAYSAYATSGLLYVMHADGVTFQYLWPNAPALNSIASVYAGSGIIIFGAIFSRIFLKTNRRHPIIDKLLLAIIIVTIALNIFLIPTNPQLLKKTLVVMSLVAIATFAVSAVVAALRRFREVRFYLVAWVGAVLSATLLNLNHIFGFNIGQELLYDSMRGVMVFDAAMMGFAIADRYHQLRQSRQAALSESLNRANHNIELNQRLLELEHQFSVASQIARHRDEHIQNTVHDLRQPLHALRVNVHNVLRGEPSQAETVKSLEATFTYLEGLVAQQLLVDTHAEPTHHECRRGAALGLQQVLNSVHEMFLDDAASKGLSLRLEGNGVEATVEPLVLMRVLSNLVSNAIKYTSSGEIRVSAHALKDGVAVRVTDTGPGLTEAEFEEASKRSVRLNGSHETAEGSGLGLAIAHEYATRNGMDLILLSGENGGSSIELLIPHRFAEPSFL